MTDGAGRSIDLAHNTRNCRNHNSYPGGTNQTFTLDSTGKLKTHLDANGISVTRTFDTLNHKTSQAYSANTAANCRASPPLTPTASR